MGGEVTDPIAAFILARVADEERDARAATDGPWHTKPDADEHLLVVGDGVGIVVGRDGDSVTEDGDARHIARQDPPSTLSRCTALRPLVELCDTEHDPTGPPVPMDCIGQAEVLRHLAAIWRDHEDYDPSWAVA